MTHRLHLFEGLGIAMAVVVFAVLLLAAPRRDQSRKDEA